MQGRGTPKTKHDETSLHDGMGNSVVVEGINVCAIVFRLLQLKFTHFLTHKSTLLITYIIELHQLVRVSR